jgi:hypothetical protein
MPVSLYGIKKQIMSIDKQIEEVIADIAVAMVERNDIPNYSERALLNAVIVFSNLLYVHQWNLMERENMPIKDRKNMVEKFGEELRNLVKIYTSIDLHEISK